VGRLLFRPVCFFERSRSTTTGFYSSCVGLFPFLILVRLSNPTSQSKGLDSTEEFTFFDSLFFHLCLTIIVPISSRLLVDNFFFPVLDPGKTSPMCFPPYSLGIRRRTLPPMFFVLNCLLTFLFPKLLQTSASVPAPGFN